MARVIENERQEEAKEKGSTLQELSRRRASLIAAFQDYIHVTFHELHLASQEETDALRSPLLQMTLTEEDIRAWEKFRPLIQKHLYAAQVLHVTIGHLLEQADNLLDTHDIATWHMFFQNTNIGFREKERGAEELAAKLSVQSTQNADQHPPKGKKEHVVEANILKKEQKPHPENTLPQKSPKPREADLQHEGPLSLLHNTQLHARWLLTLLPSSLAPLYIAAAKRGSTALNAVQKTMEQSLLRQNLGLQHQRSTIVLTREKLQNTEEPLAICQVSVAQGNEAKTVILEPISLQTQSGIVHGIHQLLLQDLRTLEQNGMCI